VELLIYGIEQTEDGRWLVTNQTYENILAELDTFDEAVAWLGENKGLLDGHKQSG
jgi:hypothetical protein